MAKVLKIAASIFFGAVILISFLDLKDMWLAIVIGICGLFIMWRKKPNKASASIAKQNEANAPTVKIDMGRTYNFYVVGTFFEQSGEKTGQEILATIPAKIMREYEEPFYGGYSLKEMLDEYIDEVDIYDGFKFDVEVKETSYDGEYAVEVYLLDEEERYKIGYVSKDDLELFRKVYNQDCTLWIEVSGGKTKDVNGEIEESKYEPILYVR